MCVRVLHRCVSEGTHLQMTTFICFVNITVVRIRSSGCNVGGKHPAYAGRMSLSLCDVMLFDLVVCAVMCAQ